MTLHPAMPLDADTLSFSLTYGGTLVVALLMFIGQLTTVGILLAVAGTIRLTAYPIQAISRLFSRSVRSKNGRRVSVNPPVSGLLLVRVSPYSAGSATMWACRRAFAACPSGLPRSPPPVTPDSGHCQDSRC